MSIRFMHARKNTVILIVSGLICFFLLSSCATNPATRRPELMLVSQEKEFQIGQQVDKQVREEMGLYTESQELRTQLKKMAENIGRQSDRPDLIYRLEIVDTPDFNAFAVPGGFVYVHRGLLERINSMDEIASVLGHEIAHVAARHSASQISKMQLINLGLLGVAIATGGKVQNFSPLIDLGAVLTFSKFSRDDEREADYFGTRYMVEAGYNPKSSIDVMKQIQRINDREPGSLETWFMTHPPTSERLVILDEELNRISSRNPEVLKRRIRRNEFIGLLDGMAVGQWNGSELIRDDTYFNKESMVSIPIPDGWQVQIKNKNYTAVFYNDKKDSFAFFNVQPLRDRMTSGSYFNSLSEQLRQKGFRELRSSKAGGLAHGSLSGVYEGQSREQGTVRAELIAFTKGAEGFSIVGLCKEKDFENLQHLFEKMISGLRFLSSGEAAGITPPRMRIHNVSRGETWDAITRRYFKTPKGKEQLAEYNGFKADVSPEPGTLLKIPPSLHFK